jgi:hypothetical protein
MLLEDAFDIFQQNYCLHNLIRHDDCLVYKLSHIHFGYSEKEAEEAQKLIDHLGLPLKARSNATNGFFKDSIVIEPKDGV